MPVVPYNLTFGEVLYDNAFRRSLATSYDGTEVVGMGYISAYDWADWSLFATENGQDRRLTFSFPLNTVLDTFAISIVPFNTIDLPYEAVIGLALIGEAQIAQSNGSCTVSLELETAPASGAYNVIATKTFTGTDSLWYVHLPAGYVITTERFRVRFNNTAGSQLIVRDMCVGRRLTFAMGQHADIAPPKLVSGYVISNAVSVNGSLLGRQTRRVEKMATIELNLITPAWVRTSWDPFARHAVSTPFWYCWNYNTYPEDTCFATATNVEPPVNDSRPGTMKVSMPLRVIQ